MSLTSSSQSRNLSIRYPGVSIKRAVPQFASAVLTIIDPSFDDGHPLSHAWVESRSGELRDGKWRSGATHAVHLQIGRILHARMSALADDAACVLCRLD